MSEETRMLFNLINEAREVHADLSYSLGIYFGYPDCCRAAFCQDVRNGRIPDRNIDGSGFVPCMKHYNLIKSGKIKLENLISDRICPTKFTR